MGTSIILCATQRSGSTLVCEDFRNNGLGLAEEYFLPFIDKRDVDAEKMVENVRLKGTDDGGVFSVKIMSSYAGKIDRHLLRNEGGDAGPLWGALAEEYRDAAWVYLRRFSIVRQAISQIKSRKTGINHALSRSDAKISPGKSVLGYRGEDEPSVVIEDAEIEGNCLSIVKQNEMWDIFFAESGIAPILIDYETIIKGVSYINEICVAAGIERPSLNADRALMRLSNSLSDRVYRAFVASTEGPAAPAPQKPGKPAAGAVEMSPAQSEFKPDAGKVVSIARARWVDTPYYCAAESLNRTQWDNLITPFLKDTRIDFTSTLELAVGHGRMAAILLEKATTYVGLDVLHENIEVCRARFGETPERRFIVNDGVGLTDVDDSSVTFGFCFDSMVHFDVDVIRSYLREFYRVLVRGGHVFLHHSNFARNPIGNFQIAPHARNFMTVELFQLLAKKEGLITLKSAKIDWGAGDRRMLEHDGLELIRRP